MPGSFPYFIEEGRIDFLMIEKIAGKQLQKWEKPGQNPILHQEFPIF